MIFPLLPHDRTDNVNPQSRLCRHIRCAPVAPRQPVTPRARAHLPLRLGKHSCFRAGTAMPHVGDGWNANGHRAIVAFVCGALFGGAA